MNMSTLHVGLVGPLPPPFGGMANQTRQLARLLREEGATVELIQVNAPYQPDWAGRIKGLRALFRLIPYLANLWHAAGKVQLFHVMANSGWSWHLYAAPAIWIGRIRNIPVIVNYRGGEAGTFFERSFFWVKPSLSRTKAIIVPSGFLKAVFNKRGYTTHTVPNIIDLSRFNTASMSSSQSLSDAPHIILTRNLEPIYDNATALRAFHRVQRIFPQARLSIAGSGPEKQILEDLVHELDMGNAVTFVGRVENEAIADLYRSADLMINPSLVDNMPISILEALASGVPVVSTNVGGVPYLVEHGETALLVPPQDFVAMSEAILQILGDSDLRQRFKEKGFESIQSYTWPNVKSRLMTVYAQVLEQSEAA